MKIWFACTFLLLLVAGCATEAPQSKPTHAPRTLTPDQEIAEPAVRPKFQAADTLRPTPDSVP